MLCNVFVKATPRMDGSFLLCYKTPYLAAGGPHIWGPHALLAAPMWAFMAWQEAEQKHVYIEHGCIPSSPAKRCLGVYQRPRLMHGCLRLGSTPTQTTDSWSVTRNMAHPIGSFRNGCGYAGFSLWFHLPRCHSSTCF